MSFDLIFGVLMVALFLFFTFGAYRAVRRARIAEYDEQCAARYDKETDMIRIRKTTPEEMEKWLTQKP